MKSFVLDEEIDLLELQDNADKTSADLLNTMPYVDTLTECVMNAPADKTFNIGLFGEWGSGKSSIIKTFKRKIDERYSAEGKKVKVITYDAWKYANDSFRRMFLLQIQQDLGFEKKELMNKFYLNSSEDAHIDTRFDWKTFSIGFFVVLAAIIGIVCFTDFPTNGKIMATAIVSLCSLSFTIIRGLFREVKVNIQRPHLFAPEQFEDCFNEMCEKAHHMAGMPLSYLKWINCEVGEEGVDRLVIVIDNVDRCSSELAYELLTNIKNFLGCKHNTVFIVPVDEDALKLHFKHKADNMHDDSAEFLRKFFNICIRIKPYKRDEMYDFADAINKKHNLGFEPTTVSLVANEFAHNPRRIIQMFNNLNVELQSLPREFEEKHQNIVCLLLIIREEYPQFYAKVQAEPLALFFSDKRQDVSDEKINVFLNLNSAIIDAYANDVFVIERILSNTPIEGRIPQTIKNDYLKKTYSKESLDYIAEGTHRSSLILYVENRLRLAINRCLWETDVKNNVDRLLSLNYAIQLSKEENFRFVGMISNEDVFDHIAEKQTNMHNLIDYAAQLEHQGIPLLASRLSAYISTNGAVDDKYNEKMDVWYACARLSSSKIKALKDVALAACKQDFKGVISQDYGHENSPIVFSDEIINYMLSLMISNEDEVVNIMLHIASMTTLSASNLVAFIKAIDGITPKYNYANNNTPELQKRLKVLNQMLSLCTGTRLNSSEAQIIKDAYKKYAHITNVPIRGSYPNSIKQHAFFLDNLGKPEIIGDFLEFFKLSSLVTWEAIIHPQTLIMILESKNYDIEITDILYELKSAGYPVQNYTDPLLKIVTYSEKYLLLLDYVLKLTTPDGQYYVGSDTVKNEYEKLLAYVLDDNNKEVALQIKAIQNIAKDTRNSEVLTSLLLGKNKDWLLSLPNELMEYAINVFESNIEEYKDQQNVLMLLAAKGSSMGKKTIVKIANAKINDDKERAFGMEIIKSFTSLSATDSKPLISSLEYLKENKLETSEAVDSCLQHLEDIKSTRGVKNE